MRIFARPIEDEWTEAESRDGQFRADATGNVEHPSEHRRSVRSERVSGSVNLENARIQNTTFYAIHTRDVETCQRRPSQNPAMSVVFHAQLHVQLSALTVPSTDTHLSRSHRVCRTPWGLPTTDGSDTPRDIEMLV
jgi:hypothetical protein